MPFNHRMTINLFLRNWNRNFNKSTTKLKISVGVPTNPFRVLILVAMVVSWHHVHEYNVLVVRVQSVQLYLNRRKHSPAINIVVYWVTKRFARRAPLVSFDLCWCHLARLKVFNVLVSIITLSLFEQPFSIFHSGAW